MADIASLGALRAEAHDLVKEYAEKIAAACGIELPVIEVPRGYDSEHIRTYEIVKIAKLVEVVGKAALEKLEAAAKAEAVKVEDAAKSEFAKLEDKVKK
jgi:hypothetical protein